ncbi:nucleotide exchange factor GrpE [Archangium gephyra]|nr:nucleotide exchange factor GrpE [Archangium gephyra]
MERRSETIGVDLMLTLLRRLFIGRSGVHELPGATPPAESPPTWGTLLLDTVQKSSRAQARLALHVEDLERKLEGGLAELRGSLSSLRGATSGNPSGREPPWDELLDALDLLEEASRVAADAALASGLMGVAARLERFLTSSGITRMTSIGHIPDGRLFRIVGTQPHPSFAEGAIARVVRAAALRGERLIREGEALIVRNTP